MNFLVPSEDSYINRRNFMASQSFQAVRRLQDAGAPLPLVIANPVWQTLIDKIDSNITERASMLDQALSKIPGNKRPSIPTFDGEDGTDVAKRQRLGSNGDDLAARKQALLAKIEGIEGSTESAHQQDDYEAYRRQCWIQYYEWMEKQKKAGEVEQVAAAEESSASEDEDEEIHNALLGLS